MMSHLFFKTPESTLTSVLHDDASKIICIVQTVVIFIYIGASVHLIPK